MLAQLDSQLSVAYQQLMISSDQGNAAGVAAVYTETGQLLPAYSAAIVGRAGAALENLDPQSRNQACRRRLLI